MGGVVQESNLGETLVIKEEVLDHCDVVYAALSKATHLKTLFCSEKWEEKKRELHLLCQALREGSAGEEVCSLFHLEQTWGVKNENVEVLWALLKSLGSVTLKDGSELVSVPELAQITYISLVLKEAALKRRKKALLVPNVVGKRTPELQTDFDTRSKLSLFEDHFESILRLILGVPPTCMSSSLVVTPADIDALSVWLRPRQGSFKLREISPFFVSHFHASFKDVADWLKAGVGSGNEDSMNIFRAQKKVLVKEISDGTSMQSCTRITACTDSTIYCLFPVEFLLISHCRNCTIVVGAAKFAQTLQSSNVKLIIACKTKVISNCNDCTFYLGTNECPLLIGDNRNVTLAPYNSYYSSLPDHLAHFNISGDINYWNLPKVIDSPYVDSEDHKGVFSIMLPEKWATFVIPFVFVSESKSKGEGLEGDAGKATNAKQSKLTKDKPFIAPKAYQKRLDGVVSRVDHVRSKITNANLGQHEREELQQAIQAHFKDWLLKTEHLQEIQALTQMEKLSL